MKTTILKIGSIIVPIVFVVVVVAFVVLVRTAGPDDQLPAAVVPYLAASAIIMFLSVGCLWFYIIFYIIHAAKNSRLAGGWKAAWICALWFLNIIVIPIYGLMFFRRDSIPEHQTRPPS
jgi:hypothetical protein